MNPHLALIGIVISIGIFLGGYWKGYADADKSAALEAKQEHIDRMGVWLKAANEARENADALAEESRASADKRLMELEHARSENSRLRDDVERSRVRLTITGTCSGAVPLGRPDPGMDHGAACELDAAARQDYFALRDGIAKQYSQLIAAQDRIRSLERYARVCAVP